MSSDVSLGAATLHVSHGPAIVAAVGALAALAAALRVRRVLASGAPAGERRWRWTVLGLAPLALLVLANRSGRVASGTGSALLLDIAPALLATVLAGRATDWIRARSAASRERESAAAVAAIAWAGALIAQWALLQANALLQLAVPSFEIPEPAMVQVGRKATVVPRVFIRENDRRSRTSLRWAARPLALDGDRAGDKSVTFQADAEGMSALAVSVPGTIRVVEERGDPRLPLRVGNRWRYHVEAVHAVGGLVGLIGGPTKTAVTREVRVAEASEIMNGAVRVFRLVIGEGTDPNVDVFAADGQLFIAGASSHLPLFSPSSSQGAFDFALIGRGCTCAEVGPLRGPNACSTRTRAGAAERIAVTAFALGIAGPDDADIAWILDDTTAGPADAPAVTAPAGAPQCAAPKPALAVIGPGNDAPPEKPPTPAENLAAAPYWTVQSGSIPVGETEALFESAGATPVPARNAALLACSIRHYGRPDGIFGGGAPDLTVTLRVGDMPPVKRDNPPDQHAAFVTLPVSLRGGERITAHLVDRNVGADDKDLGEVSVTVGDSLPARSAEGDPSIECHGVEPAKIEAALTAALSRADEALAGAARENLHPLSGVEALGLGLALRPGRAAILDAAAIAGFADQRVMRRLAWERRLEDGFAAQAAPLVRELAARKQDEARWDERNDTPLAVRAEGFACGPDVQRAHAAADEAFGAGALARWGCVLRVAVENLSSSDHWQDLGWPGSMPPPPWLAWESGRTMELRLIDVAGARARGPRRVLPAHRKGTMIFVPVGPVDPAAGGAMVMLGAKPVVLAVPAAR